MAAGAPHSSDREHPGVSWTVEPFERPGSRTPRGGSQKTSVVWIAGNALRHPCALTTAVFFWSLRFGDRR